MKKTEKKDGKIITTQSFDEYFGSKKKAKLFIKRMNEVLSNPYQPERLSPKDLQG